MMPIKRRDLMILFFVIVVFFFLAVFSTLGDHWSVANAQGTNPPTPTMTLTPDPNAPREVPEADTLVLLGGGLGGLTVWLGWQRYRLKSRLG